MKRMLRSFRRLAYASLGLALTLAVAVPGLASAAQMQNRGLEMSDSTPGKTGVTYKLFFDPASVTAAASSIVVDFCSNSPLQGDHCTAVGGTDTPNTAGAGGSGVADVQDTSSDGTGTQQNTHHTVKINTVNLSGGPGFNIAITGITNPSVTGTFYARILVYGTATGAGSADDYVPDGGGPTAAVPTQGSFGDYGGAALSTATLISITAKVQEQLTFCVSGPSGGVDPITASCAGAVSPALTLGHGTPTAVLSNTLIDTSPIYSLLSTNASQGAIVRMKAGNTCTNLAANFLGGLSTNGGTTCAIKAIDSHVGPAGVALTAGAPAGNPGGAFGLCVKAGTANTVAVAPYDAPSGTACDSATNLSDNSGNGFGSLTTPFGMDDTVTSTYGSTLLNTASLPVNAEKDTYVFAATAANTTPAGIYTGSESLIATGTF